MKKKFLLSLLLMFVLLFVFGCSNKNTAKDSFDQYISFWNKNDFKSMYSIISLDSKKNISEKDFIEKYKNIYDGIDLSKISITPEYPKDFKKDSNGTVTIPFKVTMNTSAGVINFNDNAYLKQEDINKTKTWTINWSNKMIFPDLGDGEKVRVDKKLGNRGQIRSANGTYLAQNGSVAEIGIVAGKISTNDSNTKNKIAQILNISSDSIDKKLSASYVKPDMFVPIDTISKDSTDKISALSQISGILIKDKSARVYPLKDKAAFITGYVQPINQDELSKLKNQGYTKNDVVGKSGLEKIYEKQLKSEDGAEIYILDKNGNKKKTIAKKDPKNGTDLNVTINTDIQAALYNQYNGDSGTAVAMQPKTGEVLALISSPAYDPNDFVLGMSSDKWNSLNNDPKKPFLNRFQTAFAPGSTFKPITAAIGLKTGKIDPNAVKSITGLTWQKDNSWGGYSVTRAEEYTSPPNLLNALVHSDNIYFAQAALDIGKDNFTSESKNFGIGENMPFEYQMTTSKLSKDNTISTDIQLADSGYGQGEILINPLHLSTIYTSFVNGGNIINPYLNADKKASSSSKVWKANVFSQDTANTILGDLTQVVSNPEGTGHDAYIPNIPLAGKTGTAEIKANQNDKTGTENGWFVAVNTNDPKLLVLEMYEDVKSKGGSHYVVPKVKDIFQQFCK
jgi:penicillin-binding protein